MRAGSAAKATATAEGRGHIRRLGRPGVSSSHPAVLKSPVAPGPYSSICMSNTRQTTFAWPPSCRELVRRLDKCRICGQPRGASTPSTSSRPGRRPPFISWGSGVGFVGRPTNPLSSAATWLLDPTKQ